MNKENESAVSFSQLGEEFKQCLDEFFEYAEELSKNGLKRLVKALAAHPLEDDLIKLIHEDEKEAYNIGVQIQSIKLNMMVESLQQEALAQREQEVNKEK